MGTMRFDGGDCSARGSIGGVAHLTPMSTGMAHLFRSRACRTTRKHAHTRYVKRCLPYESFSLRRPPAAAPRTVSAAACKPLPCPNQFVHAATTHKA
eukprot:3930963-Pleurochrysis_carterae.AAC.1